MCNAQSKFEVFENVVVMIFITGISLSLPLMALALVQESSNERENEQAIKDLEDRLDALE